MILRPLAYFLPVLFVACSTNPDNRNKNSSQKRVVSTQIEPAISSPSSGMVYFKGGNFMMGSSKGSPLEQPVHPVVVKPFKIDKYPVTVKEFRKFTEATGYLTEAERFGDSGVFDFKSSAWTLLQGANWQFPLGKRASKAEDNHPVTQVSWNDAVSYANWCGKRLCTEAEWEFAARCGGTSMTKFSWGNSLIVNGKYMANVWQGQDLQASQGADGFELTSPVGYYGESCGLTDMGGNVWNWCADVFKPYPGNDTPFQENPNLRVIRGGSFFFDQNGENSFSTTGRASNTQETSLFNTGFRCAIDAK